MSNEHQPADPLQDDEAGIEDLLRQVGARAEPDEDVMEAARAAVHAEWRSVIEARLRRRRVVAFGLAASVAGLLAVSVVSWREPVTPTAPIMVATVVRVDGDVRIGDGATAHSAKAGEVLLSGVRIQ